ncbi:MAG TPA: TolC family protein [Alphaproteobacteria bacterium]|nr:TolC family protein [Alphaproteobacteria bacterium]
MKRNQGIRTGIGLLLPLALAACETYSPLPLEQQPHLAAKVTELKAVPPPNWSDIGPIALDRPLNISTVALLAVENNPDLVAARADRGVAEAQVVQAGLLPNPSFSGNYGFLRAGPGTVDSWTAGLSEDIRALVTLGSQRKSAELGANQIEADFLWQEWQVVGKARLLFIDTVKQDRARQLLGEARNVLADRMARDQKAVEQGNLTLSAISPDLAALADIDKQIADADRQAAQRRRDLDVLIGLDPSVRLDLASDIVVPRIDPPKIEEALHRSLMSRPDLVALQLGYDAQEEKVYGAILAQFPAFVLGGSGGHDNSAIYQIGPTVTMDLPIFNHNQGNIAIERATRRKLHDEYTNRYNTAESEIRGLLADLSLLQGQLAVARDSAAEADRARRSADDAYRAGLIDARAYVDLIVAALTREQEVVSIEQSILEQQVALATVTGTGMPAVDPLPAPAGASSS